MDLSFFSKFKCDICKKKFRKIEELMQHKQILHGKDLLYECKQCNASFTGMEQMRDHARRFHSYNKIIDERKKNLDSKDI